MPKHKSPGDSNFAKERRKQKALRRKRVAAPPGGLTIPWERGRRGKRLVVSLREHEKEGLGIALAQINPRQRNISRHIRRAINEYLAGRGSWFRLEEGKGAEE